MARHQHTCCTIVPPQMLEALAENAEGEARASAINTIAVSAQLRERRMLLGGMALDSGLGGANAAGNGRPNRVIYDAEKQERPTGRLVRREGDARHRDRVVNEAYDGLGATYELYQNEYNRDSIDGRGAALEAVVHYGDGIGNAFWNGSRMLFGDGDNVIFSGFTKAIDVIGHELTHGVVQHTSNLEYNFQSGALNESFADVFGSLVKQRENGESATAADWLIGAGIFVPDINAKALRSMSDPGTAYDDPRLGKDQQPGHMDDYVELPNTRRGDWGGVHINSGIPNKAFYLVATEIGGYAWEQAGRIWYDTMLALDSQSQFQDCANASYRLAGQYRNAVRDAWDEVGITVDSGDDRLANGQGRGRKPASNGARQSLEKAIKHLQKLAEQLS